MNGKLVRGGQIGLCGMAVAALMAMGSAPAAADSVRVGVSPNGLNIVVADRDKDHRKGRGYDRYDDDHRRRGDDHYHQERSGWKGQNNWRRSARFWYFDGWEPAGRYRNANYHNQCIPVQKQGRWRGKPAIIGAKACTNRYGRPYVVNRSVHLVQLLGRYGHYHGDMYCDVRH